MQATIKETLLCWQDSLIGIMEKKVWRAESLCLFWSLWKEGYIRVFENMEFFVQKLKILFLRNLLTRTKLFIGESLMSLNDFIDLLDPFEEGSGFSFSLPLCFLVAIVYILFAMVCSFLVSFYLFPFINKRFRKKKKLKGLVNTILDQEHFRELTSPFVHVWDKRPPNADPYRIVVLPSFFSSWFIFLSYLT